MYELGGPGRGGPVFHALFDCVLYASRPDQ